MGGYRHLYGQSICWLCENAVPHDGCGCSWAKHLIPIEGWDAIKSENSWADQFNEPIYRVIKCPQFTPDTHEDVVDKDAEGLENLAVAVAKVACDDYRRYYRRICIYKSQSVKRKLYSDKYYRLYGRLIRDGSAERARGHLTALRRFFLSDYARNLLAMEYDWLMDKLEEDVQRELQGAS